MTSTVNSYLYSLVLVDYDSPSYVFLAAPGCREISHTLLVLLLRMLHILVAWTLGQLGSFSGQLWDDWLVQQLMIRSEPWNPSGIEYCWFVNAFS